MGVWNRGKSKASFGYLRYAELKTCLSHVPEVSNKEEEAGGILENWPQRLELKTCLSHVPEVSNKEEEAGGILENWPQRLEFVSYMEGIPSKAKNLPMNLLLGKLYRISHGRAVVAIYKECLRHCPFILEAITALSELGSTAKDIISLFPQGPIIVVASIVGGYWIMSLDNIEEASKDTPGRSFYYAMEPLRHMCLFLQWSLVCCNFHSLTFGYNYQLFSKIVYNFTALWCCIRVFMLADKLKLVNQYRPNTMEIAFAIRKLPLTKAKRYLEDVLAHKQAIPFRRFCRSVGERFGCGCSVCFSYPAYMSSPCLIELILSKKEEAVQKELATNKKSQALRSGASS
ncbi:GPI ethanolamine phosphate transferase [Trifolium repens]|nr:GPI ethanolamine phosphate transferase [Trifolium repens]